MKQLILIRRSLTYLTLAVLSLIYSCSKKDPNPDCGCDGKPYRQIKNQEASYLGNGTFMIFETGDTTSARSWVVACQIDSTWVKSEDAKIRNYLISGDLKQTCFTGPTISTLVAVPPFITITSIKKK